MLDQHQRAGLNWHPLRDVGRSGNYALSVLGLDAKGGLRYLMACGHQSIQGHATCERGCGEAPNWRMPYVQHEDWMIAAKRMDRYGVQEAEDLTRLPKRLRPGIDEMRMPILFHRENVVDPRRVA